MFSSLLTFFFLDTFFLLTQTKQLSCVVPEGLKAGDAFQIRAEGAMYQVNVPSGAKPGDTVKIPIAGPQPIRIQANVVAVNAVAPAQPVVPVVMGQPQQPVVVMGTPQQPQQQQPQPVITQPGVEKMPIPLAREPQEFVCPFCNQKGTSKVSFESGLCTWIWCCAVRQSNLHNSQLSQKKQQYQYIFVHFFFLFVLH
jgi:hypothetical protein